MYKPVPQIGGDYFSIDTISVDNSTSIYYNISPDIYHFYDSSTIQIMSTNKALNEQLIQKYRSDIQHYQGQIVALDGILPQQLIDFQNRTIEYNTDMGIYISDMRIYRNNLSTYSSQHTSYVNAINRSTAIAISTSSLLWEYNSISIEISTISSSDIMLNSSTFELGASNVSQAQYLCSVILVGLYNERHSVQERIDDITPAYIIETNNNSTLNGSISILNNALNDLKIIQDDTNIKVGVLNRRRIEAEGDYYHAKKNDEYTSSINAEISATKIYDLASIEMTNLQNGGVNISSSSRYTYLSTHMDDLQDLKEHATAKRIQLERDIHDIRDHTYENVLNSLKSTAEGYIQDRHGCQRDIQIYDRQINDINTSTAYLQALLSTDYSLESIERRYSTNTYIYNSTLQGLWDNIYMEGKTLNQKEESYNTYIQTRDNLSIREKTLTDMLTNITFEYSSMIIQSGGGDTNTASTLREMLYLLNRNLQNFENDSNTTNAILSTSYNKELMLYINKATIISSCINIQIANKAIAATFNIDSITPSSISVMYGNIRSYKAFQPYINDFMDVCRAELLYKQQYLLSKSQFELQAVYQITSTNKLLDGIEYMKLINKYDISVQEINKYMDSRIQKYNSMSTILMKSLNIFDNDIKNELTLSKTYYIPIQCIDGYTITYGTQTHICNDNNIHSPFTYTIDALLPFVMPTPSKIESRGNIPILPKSGFVLPKPPTCLALESDPNEYDVKYRSSTNNITTTSTIPLNATGKFADKVSIILGTNDMYISQIVIIDKNGRNIAFKMAPIITTPSLTTTTFRTTTSLVTTSMVLNRSLTDGSIVTDIAYGQRAYTPPPFSSIYKIQGGSRIDFNFGQVFELIGIKIYQTQQPTTTRGIRIRILNTTSTITEYSLPDKNDSITPYYFNTNIAGIDPNYKGLCGIMARYVRIIGPPSLPSGFYFHISQVAVIGNNGQNLALGIIPNAVFASSITTSRTLTTTLGSATPSRITDGQYYARPERICYTGSPSYLEIDLGSSVDITAVQIYNTSDNRDSYQSALSIGLLTEESLYAAGPISVPTDLNKNNIDFRYPGSDTQCPIQLEWSSSIYGNGGLICQYIRIDGCQGIKRLEVVDIMGIDVGFFKNIYGNGTNKNLINTDGNTIAYNGTWLLLDLGEKKEICAVRSDIFLTASIRFSNDQTTSIYTAEFYGEIDTRVDPETSPYSKVVTKTLTKYGPLGVFAQVIECPGTFIIVDATGKGLGPFTTRKDMGRLYEITAINTNQQDVEIKLYDCNKFLIMKGNANMPDSNANIWIAPFTNAKITDPAIKAIIPRKPYQIRYGYNLGTTSSIVQSGGQTTTGPLTTTRALTTIAPPTMTLPYTGGVGVYARYIKITPSSSTLPVKISQIVAVDASGINVAFEKESFYIGSVTSNPQRIVDGKFQNILGAQSFISWENYIVRSDTASYISPPGGYIVIDLLDEYAINSILFIGTTSTDQPGNIGAIVQLYDKFDNIVGIHPVSEIIRLFQMDLLDFRRDITLAVSGAFSTRIEVRERIVEVGPTGCGIMGQYIRIQGTSVELSQIILRDPSGKNIAMYKPTYSPGSSISSRINDGLYYLRNRTDGFVGTDYVEINLEQEYELVSIIVAPLSTTSEAIKNNMLVLIYNKYRDVIAIQKELYNYIGSSFKINTNTFTILNELIGVQARSKLVTSKFENGLQAALANDILTKAVIIQASNTIYNICNEINNNRPYVRDASGNITDVRYVRLFNQLQYVKVSQLMVYDGNGENVAFHMNTYATHTLSGRYAAYATDGYGGFFHTPRLETSSYISDKKRYDTLEVNLGSNMAISAVRYIPPNTTQNNMEGMQIQLLDSNKNILNQYVFLSTDVGERLIDFRGLANRSIPIGLLIMPKITTLF